MESMVQMRPVHPAAAYVGGKRRLAKRVIEAISRVPHEIYAEGFVGMGGVFLRRPRAPRAEVINDASREVATFFRILQRHYPQFMEMLRFQVSSRAAFERLVKTDPTTLTDLEQAARFLYLQRLAHGGKVVGRTFGVDPRGGSIKAPSRVVHREPERLPRGPRVLRRHDLRERLDPLFRGGRRWGDGRGGADHEIAFGIVKSSPEADVKESRSWRRATEARGALQGRKVGPGAADHEGAQRQVLESDGDDGEAAQAVEPNESG
jgi:hypothetical protein